jgi:hypothetical protein
MILYGMDLDPAGHIAFRQPSMKNVTIAAGRLREYSEPIIESFHES